MKSEVNTIKTQWKSIESAPLNKPILIREGKNILPDLVCWRNKTPENSINGNKILSRPAGWFTLHKGGRSHVVPKEWTEIPE